MLIPGLVSVVIPVHNRPTLLRRSVASALAQDWRPLEVIVVDDGSDDATPAVIDELAAAAPEVLRPLRRETPGGPGRAREEGRTHVRGEFVQYLDSDDVLAPGKLRGQVAALREHPGCDVCYGLDRSDHRRPDGEVVSVAHDVPVLERLYPRLFLDRPWFTFNPLYRRSIVDRVGPWRPLWFSEDIEYDSRMAVAGARLCFVPIPTGTLARTGHEHLSRGRPTRRTLVGWTSARESILAGARAVGAPESGPEFDVFRRSVFAVARQCGEAGLVRRSERAFDLARSLAERPDALVWRAYGAIARTIGWRPAGVLSRCLDRIRHATRRACP